MCFTHLHVHSNFSFLDAGSSIKTLVDRAKELGYASLAITDHNGLYGAVRFYKYALESGIKPIIGAEMRTEDGHHLILLAKSINGYSNLCKIVTRAHLSHEKGKAAASLDVISEYKDDLFCLSGCRNGLLPSLLREGSPDAAEQAAMRYIEIFGKENFFIEMQNHFLPGDRLLCSQLYSIAGKLGLEVVATNNCHYAAKEDFKVQDVLACVQSITKLDERDPIRKQNAEYYLKSQKAMEKIFVKYPEAIRNTSAIADACDIDLGLGIYRFPSFPIPKGETAYSYLCKLSFEGLERLYKPITPETIKRLEYELSIIHSMGFSEYFLVVWDIVSFSRSKGIRCSGRGSAADSMVAYCLGITIADPIEHNLLFERFLNPERKGMPDIDIDFDSLRRDEVIEHIYKRHGEDRVAMVCTVSTLSARSALRDIGKAMDFPQDEISKLASAIPHTGADHIRECMTHLPELRDSKIPIYKYDCLLDICEKIDGFPRHLSVHLGGMLISSGLLTDLVPLEWATKGVIVSQYDKDDIETLGLVKMDLLGLKNLSAIEASIPAIRENYGINLDIDNLPLDDEKTYELLRTTNTVGLFQLESPGMRGLLGRLQPLCFNDIIAQISLFRPGPMQADMINPFIKRRHGIEPVTYLHPSLQTALEETYGVILYQEQVLKVAHAIAGFTYGQSDSLRRAMTKNRTQEEMEMIRREFIEGAVKNGVEEEIAETVFSQLRAFAAYGFNKAHAASFAKISYQTAYLKAHYPAEFLAAILSCQPMGFYPGNVIIEEARRNGIEILGLDVNKSEKKFIGKDNSILTGLMQVKDISGAEIDSILQSREQRQFTSLMDFCARTSVSRQVVENLINCGAFGESRRKLLWMLGSINDGTFHKRYDLTADQNMLFGEGGIPESLASVPDVPEPQDHIKVRMDYDILGMSAICHPMAFYRETMNEMHVTPASCLSDMTHNEIVKVAGVTIVCMRPPTKSGAIIVFVTLEDETGLSDILVFPKTYDKYGSEIFNSPGLIVEGKLDKERGRGGNGSVIAERIWPITQKFRNPDLPLDTASYKERIRSAGQRSWVKGQGV